MLITFLFQSEVDVGVIVHAEVIDMKLDCPSRITVNDVIDCTAEVIGGAEFRVEIEGVNNWMTGGK